LTRARCDTPVAAAPHPAYAPRYLRSCDAWRERGARCAGLGLGLGAPAPALEAGAAPGAAGAPFNDGFIAAGAGATLRVGARARSPAPAPSAAWPHAPAPGPGAGGAGVLGWPGLASAAGSAPAPGPASGLRAAAGPAAWFLGGDGARQPARPALGGVGTLAVRCTALFGAPAPERVLAAAASSP